MIETALRRKVSFQGCFNFRDLGGYRSVDGRTVRWRRLFRSDALHHMTAEDVRFARNELRLATVIDLRSLGEVQRDKLGPLMDGPINHYHLPLIEEVRYSTTDQPNGDAFGDPFATADQYFGRLEQGGAKIATVVRLLSTGVYPAVFHCAAGKDRTGIVAAVVLSLLGVSDEQIIRDYATTSLYIEQIVERMRSMPGYSETVRDLPTAAFAARPETMAGFLERVRAKYGSVRGFVEGLGVGAEPIRRMRGLLLV